MNIYDQLDERRYTHTDTNGRTQTAVCEIVVGPNMRPVILVDPEFMDEIMTAANFTRVEA